jgi:hypothetical protein
MLLSAVGSVPILIRFPSILAIFLFCPHGSTDDHVITLNAHWKLAVLLKKIAIPKL